jgi:hypothetical protein
VRRRALALVFLGVLAGAGLYAVSRSEGSDDGDDDATSATTTQRTGDSGSSGAGGSASTAPTTTPSGGGGGDGNGPDDPATVVRVHDGDSFIARLGGGGETDVRLIGINAPDFGECLYQEGRKRLGHRRSVSRRYRAAL